MGARTTPCPKSPGPPSQRRACACNPGRSSRNRLAQQRKPGQANPAPSIQLLYLQPEAAHVEVRQEPSASCPSAGTAASPGSHPQQVPEATDVSNLPDGGSPSRRGGAVLFCDSRRKRRSCPQTALTDKAGSPSHSDPPPTDLLALCRLSAPHAGPTAPGSCPSSFPSISPTTFQSTPAQAQNEPVPHHGLPGMAPGRAPQSPAALVGTGD